MFIVRYIKNNAVKSLAMASGLALLSILLASIIYNLKSSYSSQSQSPPSSARSLAENQASSSRSTGTNDANPANPEHSTPQYLNPDAPCPPELLSCIAKQNDPIKDESCPTYKPIWVYLSADGGASWMQVGCFATSIDATRALKKAIARGYVKNKKVNISNSEIVKNDIENKDTVNPSGPTSSTASPHSTPLSNNSIQDVFSNPFNKVVEPERQSGNSAEKSLEKASDKTLDSSVDKPQKPTESDLSTAEQRTESKAEQQTNLTIVHETKQNEPTNNASADVETERSREQRHPNLTLRFKLLFGLIPIEKRTYPNEEMREKALYLWKKEQKLLEPDGTVNDKYAFKKYSEDKIMHH